MRARNQGCGLTWTCLLMVFLLQALMPQALRRAGVVRIGTTVSPYLVIPKGASSGPCPDSHPFAFAGGTQCCSDYLDYLDSTRSLDIYDSVEHCAPGNHLPCPLLAGGSKCKFQPDLTRCQTDHPYAFDDGNKCCNHYTRDNSPDLVLELKDGKEHCIDNVPCPGLPFKKCYPEAAPCSPGNGTCNIGNGPCNSNHNCTGTLVCGYNEGACDTAAGLHGPEDSCCTDHYRCDGIEDGCCTVSTPCGKGDGDCDFDEDCLGNLKCGNDNCEQETGSFDLGDDCCE